MAVPTQQVVLRGNVVVAAKKMDQDPGIIMYDVNGTKQTIPYGGNVIIGSPPKYRDTVCLAIARCV